MRMEQLSICVFFNFSHQQFSVYRSFSSLVNLFLGNFLNFVLYLFIILCIVAQSCPSLCDPMDCSPPGFSVHEDFPGKNTGVGCHALLQGIFSTQGSNPSLLHCRWILYHLSHQGSPIPRYFILFDAIINGIFFFISLFDCLLLVH